MKKILSVLAWCCVAVCIGEDALLADLGLHSPAAQQGRKESCVAAPPPANPAQHSGAEGMPPLPLPAVSLRRTEKKNPPKPPVLIAKLRTARQSDWNTNPADARNLLKWMAKSMNVHFSDMTLPAAQIPADPAAVPVLYRTGHDAFSFSPVERERLVGYLRMGGSLVFEACCGKSEFVESALREMRQLFPERPPYRLSAEHPLFHSYFDLSRFGYRPQALAAGADSADPAVIGVDIGCRTAVILFRWDVSCGWDGQKDTEKHHCLGYDVETAQKLGANLMSYVTSERSAALPLSQAMEFTDATRNQAGKLAIAQLKYGGMWKTREAGLSMLLHSFHQQTKIPVTFSRKEVELTSRHLSDFPLVYMTGHRDFSFSGEERAALVQYLQNGGVLLAESCCGRVEFASAFFREISRAFPDGKLEQVPLQDALFQYPNRLAALQARPFLRQSEKHPEIPPVIYRMTMGGGQTAVLFSPFGMACGWEMAQCPYCRGYDQKDALLLGMNLLYSVLMN